MKKLTLLWKKYRLN